MSPLISIIIPSYGIPFFLEKSINSVCNQTFSHWELIIVDDNNPGTPARNQTKKIVEDIAAKDNRVVYIQHPRNLNGAVARNTGFAVAKGKYIALLDSDDEYSPERLQLCYDALEKAPKEVAGVYTGCEFRRKGNTYHKEMNVQSGNFLVETLACKFMFCTGSNIFVRKTVVDELKGFDPDFLRHQDYEFLVRLFERYTLEGIQKVLVVKNNEDINLPNVKKLIDIKKQYLEKFSYIIKSLSIEEQRYIYQSNYIGVAEIALSQGDKKIASEYYNKAKEYGNLSFKTRIKRIMLPIYTLYLKWK